MDCDYKLQVCNLVSARQLIGVARGCTHLVDRNGTVTRCRELLVIGVDEADCTVDNYYAITVTLLRIWAEPLSCRRAPSETL